MEDNIPLVLAELAHLLGPLGFEQTRNGSFERRRRADGIVQRLVLQRSADADAPKICVILSATSRRVFAEHSRRHDRGVRRVLGFFGIEVQPLFAERLSRAPKGHDKDVFYLDAARIDASLVEIRELVTTQGLPFFERYADVAGMVERWREVPGFRAASLIAAALGEPAPDESDRRWVIEERAYHDALSRPRGQPS